MRIIPIIPESPLDALARFPPRALAAFILSTTMKPLPEITGKINQLAAHQEWDDHNAEVKALLGKLDNLKGIENHDRITALLAEIDNHYAEMERLKPLMFPRLYAEGGETAPAS